MLGKNAISSMYKLLFGLPLAGAIAGTSMNAYAENVKITLTCSGQRLEYLRLPGSRIVPGETYPVEIIVEDRKSKGVFIGGNGELVESNDKTIGFYGFGKSPYLSIRGKEYPCKDDFYR